MNGKTGKIRFTSIALAFGIILSACGSQVGPYYHGAGSFDAAATELQSCLDFRDGKLTQMVEYWDKWNKENGFDLGRDAGIELAIREIGGRLIFGCLDRIPQFEAEVREQYPEHLSKVKESNDRTIKYLPKYRPDEPAYLIAVRGWSAQQDYVALIDNESDDGLVGYGLGLCDYLEDDANTVEGYFRGLDQRGTSNEEIAAFAVMMSAAVEIFCPYIGYKITDSNQLRNLYYAPVTTTPAEVGNDKTLPPTATVFNPNEVNTPERKELVAVVREYLSSNSPENPVAGWSDDQIIANAKAACQTPEDMLIDDWATHSPEEGIFAKLARKHCAGDPVMLDFGLWEEYFIQEARVLTQKSALYRNMSDADLLGDADAACNTYWANEASLDVVKHFWGGFSSSELEAQAADAFVVLAIEDYYCFAGD